MASKDTKKAMKLTESDNEYLVYYKGQPETKVEDIQKVMRQGKVNKDYVESSEEELETAAQRVLEKLKLVSSESIGICSNCLYGSNLDANLPS